MTKTEKDKTKEIAGLNASREGDFRAVARLTCQAARLNRLILATEGSEVRVLEHLGDTLFTSDSDETDRIVPLAPECEWALVS
jgi:hypothetical protein